MLCAICHTRCIHMLSSCSCNTGLTQTQVYSLRNIRAHEAILKVVDLIEKQQPPALFDRLWMVTLHSSVL